MDNKRNADAKAWTRKYFRAASEASILDESVIREMKDNILISSAIHAENQEFEEITINVLNISLVKKNNFDVFNVIKKEKIKLL